MALSKSNRIILLLIVDTLFFLLELSVGAYNKIIPSSFLDLDALTPGSMQGMLFTRWPWLPTRFIWYEPPNTLQVGLHEQSLSNVLRS